MLDNLKLFWQQRRTLAGGKIGKVQVTRWKNRIGSSWKEAPQLFSSSLSRNEWKLCDFYWAARPDKVVGNHYSQFLGEICSGWTELGTSAKHPLLCHEQAHGAGESAVWPDLVTSWYVFSGLCRSRQTRLLLFSSWLVEGIHEQNKVFPKLFWGGSSQNSSMVLARVAEKGGGVEVQRSLENIRLRKITSGKITSKPLWFAY